MARSLRLVVLLTSTLVTSTLLAEGVLIQCARPCSKEIAAAKKTGGSITYEYQYVDGIAADIPSGAIPGLENIVGALVPPTVRRTSPAPPPGRPSSARSRTRWPGRGRSSFRASRCPHSARRGGKENYTLRVDADGTVLQPTN